MNVYITYFKKRFQMGLQYRTAALAGVATQFFWGFMYLMIFKAFYDYSSKPQSMTFDQLVQYIWMQQALLAFVMLWFRDGSLFELITTGNIAYELTRPLSIYKFWYAKLLGQRVAAVALRCVPIIFVASLLPEPYRMHFPLNVAQAIGFILTMALGVFVVVGISMFIYILTFKTMSPLGSTLIISVMGEFFAGQIIPIPLMLDWLRNLSYCLPFRYGSDVPFRIFSGHIHGTQILQEMSLQVLWLLILVLSGQWAMNRVLKNTIVQGG